MSGQVINRWEVWGPSERNPKISEFIDLPAPNYTPPGQPSFVDVFKGKDDESLIYKSLLLTKFSAFTTGIAVLVDATVGTRPQVSSNHK